MAGEMRRSEVGSSLPPRMFGAEHFAVAKSKHSVAETGLASSQSPPHHHRRSSSLSVPNSINCLTTQIEGEVEEVSS